MKLQDHPGASCTKRWNMSVVTSGKLSMSTISRVLQMSLTARFAGRSTNSSPSDQHVTLNCVNLISFDARCVAN